MKEIKSNEICRESKPKKIGIKKSDILKLYNDLSLKIEILEVEMVDLRWQITHRERFSLWKYLKSKNVIENRYLLLSFMLVAMSVSLSAYVVIFM